MTPPKVTQGRVQPLRILVIGAGPAAVTLHLPVLANLRDRNKIVLAVVCDLQRERADVAKRQFGFLDATGEAVAALECADIDAVYIFASAQLHYEYGLAALRGGKHLFVEKPIAASHAQARELAQAARTRGLVAVGGHNRRFYQALDQVRARAGKAGWRFAEAVFHKSEFGRPAPFGARTWLGANGIHGLDALVFMMGGLPERLSAWVGGRGAVQTGVAQSGATQADPLPPSVFSAIMSWPDGRQGVFLCNNDAGARREEYVFHGPGETCSVTEEGLTVATGNTVVETLIPSIGDGIAAEHESFLQAIRAGTAPAHSIEAIAPSVFLAELIEAGFNGPVQLPAAEPADTPRPRGFADKAVLITQSAGLEPALARWLPQLNLVSLEDVRESSVPRPDITAAILGSGASALPPDILAKLPRLAVVGVMGLSVARFEPDVLLARDIALLNASAAYAESVAEFALGLAILGRRHAFLSHEYMRRGGWGMRSQTAGVRGHLERTARGLRPSLRALGLESFFLGVWRTMRVEGPGGHAVGARDLRGATVGLIGWGANARAFADRLARAHARVLVYSEHAAEGDIDKSGAARASLADVLAADIVSLHRGLNKDTRHFLGVAELAKVRSGAVLINVARGALIEPGALLARLRKGDIFACLDTYEEEPLPPSHPLRSLPNVFLTSHIAGGSPDMHAAAADEVVRKVAAYLTSQAVETISDERLRTMS